MRAAAWALACGLCSAAALAPHAAHAQLFRRPVTCDDCISDYYYFDQGGQDWSCGRSTYSGHRGSDFSLIFGNRSISTGYDVVAMADGVVRHSEDGYYDQCTQCGGANCGESIGFGFANQVHIDHGEHTVVYGHMRMGSIAVSPGDRVTCGQVIGQIGSSGCSTGAHLHVEPRPVGQNYRTAFDPYEGACSPTSPSLWVDQGQPRSLPSTECDDSASPGCPAGTYPIWTCVEEGDARRRCVDGMDTTEPCPWGCEVMPTGTDDECALPPDEDGDGSRADVDCDDADAARHPGAVEACGDGVDQDCSGDDEACAPVDADLDGSPEGVDCDDGDASAYPGAAETCGDGIDQNCDGVDATCTTLDADRDGVPASSDCNDGHPGIFPGATEICGDGLDQNCDGFDAPCGGAGAGPAPGVGSTSAPIGVGPVPRTGGQESGCAVDVAAPRRPTAAHALGLVLTALLLRRRRCTAARNTQYR